MKVWIALAMVLSACREHRPPAPTDEQSARLNEAEDMLNNVAANDEGPEANAPDPSH